MLKDDLNPQQAEALAALDGPMLILAGAGSGKTRVLTYRIAELILQQKASGREIWATTFTNKAAQEMRTRVFNLLHSKGIESSDPPWVSTFHSACAEILRKFGSVMGIDPQFSIYDDTDQISLLKKVMSELKLAEKQWNPKSLRSQIDQLKNQGIDPQTYSKQASTFDREILYRVYDLYQQRLRGAQALDFGDLLMEAVRLVSENAEVRERLHARFKYFLVDEFQDTNPIQYKWVRLLAEKTRNLCVVGDEDQSIYGWRGADIANILNFQKDYPECKVIKLERNYRSTRVIVNAASHVIARNTQRMDKKVYSEGTVGDMVTVWGVQNEHEEADRVLQELKRQNIAGVGYADAAIFYRTNAQSRVIEERLRASRIPYQVYGGMKFYDRAEVKDALAYLRLCVNPKDDIAFLRAVNTPARGIGKTSVQRLLDAKVQTGASLLECANYDGMLSGKARNGMLALSDLLGELTHMSQTGRQPLDIFRHWWTESGYIRMLEDENSIESASRLENLGELQNSIQEYTDRVTTPTLSGFLNEIALYTDRETAASTEKGVSLMTLHSSKGLEFDLVFIVGLEDGLFPSQTAIAEGHLEEERRLFYVGMTRAREKLYLFFAHNRTSYGVSQPRLTSRFLKELPKECIQERGDSMRHGQLQVNWDEDVAQEHWSETFASRRSRAAQSAGDDDGLPVIQRNDHWGHSEQNSQYRKGMRVRHGEYGYGVIHKCEGTPGEERLLIYFEHFGERKFMAQYAQLEVL